MPHPLTSFIQYKDGELYIEDVPAQKIAKKMGTPTYVYSANAMVSELKKLQNGLKEIPHLICFAQKANSNLSVLNLLQKNGAGMDLVSGGELFRAHQAKVPGDRIVFSGVGKTAKEIEMGLNYPKKGIFSFNVESREELELILRVAKRLGKVAPIALRFNPDIDAKTHPYIATGLKENKFGMTRREVLQAVKDFKWNEHLFFKGLSIHIGSQILDLGPMAEAFRKTRDLLDVLQLELDRTLDFVDLGGGLGITYKNERPMNLERYCKAIVKHFKPYSRKNPEFKILLEPGRSLVGNAGVLLTEVLYRKKRPKKDFLIIDGAMNDLLRPALYQAHHEIIPVQKTQSKTSLCDVVGPVCESADCLGADRKLPQNLNSGDTLAILSAGAYGFTMASHYNSRPLAAEVLVSKGTCKTIRKRETYPDLILGETHGKSV